MRFAFFLVLFAAASCPPGQCTTAPAFTCTASSLGKQCAECEWSGWLGPNGDDCHLNPRRPLVSCHPDILSGTTLLGQCSPSVRGVKVAECDYKGFMALDKYGQITCECYFTNLNPQAHCSSQYFDPPEIQTWSASAASAKCESFQDQARGCFADVLVSKFGDPHPAVPIKCCSEAYGPPPGQLLEFNKKVFSECNTYGSWDPNDPITRGQFKPCSGHGTWNREAYNCTCDEDWNAVPVGVSFYNGQPIYSCRTCFGFFGPKPPLDAPQAENDQETYCSAPYTPDENGELAPCGGHGDWDGSRCTCHFDKIRGFWTTVRLVQTFKRVKGDGTETGEEVSLDTCSACSSGDDVKTGCLTQKGATSRPTPSSSPTLAPVEECALSCSILGPTYITGAPFLNLEGADFAGWPTECCTVTEFVLQADLYVVLNGTCLETKAGRRFVGAKGCDRVDGCAAYTYTVGHDSVSYKFTSSTSFEQVLSTTSETGMRCSS